MFHCHKARPARAFRPLGCLLVGILSVACENAAPVGDPPRPSTDAGVAAPELGAPSTRNELIWRRYRAFEQGLARALMLRDEEVCQELGRFSCVDQVHLVVLGGNDPFGPGLHEPVAGPTATTPIAVERVVWSACRAAVDADAARATPMVFLDLPLAAGATPLDLNDQAQAWAVADTITSLYRRLHARDPLPAERSAIQQLVVDEVGEAVTPAEFALLACFAVASTSESIFD